MNYSVDLNADLGEGQTSDELLLKYVSSCNIACGGHVGNHSSILKTIELAKKYKVKIGAHPSYPDKENFGRKSINISTSDLVDSIDSQLKLFQDSITKTEAEWHHIKFHGSLYNDLKTDTAKAKALVDLLRKHYSGIKLYVPPNSEILSIAKHQVPTQVEGFADRAYHDDLSLVSRQKPNAVFQSSQEVVNQVKTMVIDKTVKSINSKFIPIQVDTICIHGDTPKAIEMLEKLVEELKNHKIKIQ